MKRLCKMCAGTGRLTSLDQLSRSTAPMSVPCGMCGGLGFVDDFGCRTQDANLAAENERLKAKLDALTAISKQDDRCYARLKAKLDAVRVECVKTIEFNSEVGEASEARYILAIIDKDGDDT